MVDKDDSPTKARTPAADKAHESTASTPAADRDPLGVGRSEPLEPPARTTKVVEEESEATSAAGPHRPEPAKQVRNDPGGTPLPPAQPVARRTVAPAKVRATQTGYLYETRHRAGDVFLLLNPKDFSRKWMEYVDGRTPPKESSGQDEINRQHDERLAGQSRPTPVALGTPVADR